MIIDASIVKALHLWQPEMHSVSSVLRVFLNRIDVGQDVVVDEIRDKNGFPVPIANIRIAASRMKNKKFTIQKVDRKNSQSVRVTRTA